MVLERRDLEEAKELLEKFSARYSDDAELVRICETYGEYLETQNIEKLGELKTSLERLNSKRTFGGSGPSGLWFKDRRSNVMQVVQVA